MTLPELTRLAPPPARSIRAPRPQDFAISEAELGLALPADFKELLSAYGLGRFLDYLFAYALAGYGTTLRQNKHLLSGHSASREMFPDWYPHPLYPEAGGLLFWGGTFDGHTLCWLTEGDPDRWPVVVWHQRESRYETYQGGSVAFITDWLAGNLSPRLLPLPQQGELWFEPARDLKEVYVFLDGGEGSFTERAGLLRTLLSAAADRGSHEHGGHSDDHFATAQNWRVSYSEWPAGRKIRIAFPAAEEEAARAAVIAAVPRLGHVLRHAQTAQGAHVWAD